MTTCNHCGATLAQTDVFCRECGTKRPAPMQAAPESAHAPTPAPEPVPTAESVPAPDNVPAPENAHAAEPAPTPESVPAPAPGGIQMPAPQVAPARVFPNTDTPVNSAAAARAVPAVDEAVQARRQRRGVVLVLVGIVVLIALIAGAAVLIVNGVQSLGSGSPSSYVSDPDSARPVVTESVFPDGTANGNTNANHAHGSYAQAADGWVYYVDPFGDGDVHRIRPDGTEHETIVLDTWIGSINIMNGWLYYISYENGEAGITRTWLDDGTSERVLVAGVWDIHLRDHNVFFRSPDDKSRLFSYSLITGETKRLERGDVSEYWVDGGWVYYTLADNYDTLYRILPDGSAKEKILLDDVDNLSYRIQIEDGWLYFITYDYDVVEMVIARINLTTQEQQTIVPVENVWLFHPTEEYVYYVDYDDGCLFRATLDGTEVIRIFEAENISQINVAGDMLFIGAFPESYDTSIWYVLDKDGNLIEKTEHYYGDAAG
ncbi:DUF5050 domain-containing protein [Christensenellaceae bacterium OttesenSCG-928-L17]|nr:DUF5050 domain-containing protein [Christensenellaceae bacterium OttesenSCG-928-L17]